MWDLHGWWGVYIRVEWGYKCVCVCVRERVDSLCYHGE